MTDSTGFTLIEILIGIAILCTMLGTTYHLLSGGQRGTQHGQETTEQVMAEAILFRAMERDFQAMLPFRVQANLGTATQSQNIIFAQQDNTTDAVEFVIYEEGEFRKIGYDFDPHRKVVRRTQKDQQGITMQADHFGPGLITGFCITPPADHDHAYTVTISLQSKMKTSVGKRLFIPGYRRSRLTRQWNFQAKE